jgi:hypothetical protein
MDEAQTNQQTLAHAETICPYPSTRASHKGEPDQTVQTTQDSPTDTPAEEGPSRLKDRLGKCPLHHRPMNTPVWCDRPDEICRLIKSG